MTKDTYFIYVVIICVIAVLILLFYSLAIPYYLNDTHCLSNPNTYCYTDWKCYDTTDGSEVNVSKKFYLNEACSILNETTVKEFSYMNIYGEYKIGHPDQEVNVWDKSPECTTDGQCNYKVGDIYWKACHGTVGSPGCTTDEGKCSDVGNLNLI